MLISTDLMILLDNHNPYVRTKTLREDLVNKDSNFANFVRFHPYTYARTQQSLHPLWAAITNYHILAPTQTVLLKK